MEWWGPAYEFTSTDDGRNLEFRIARCKRWVDLLMAIVGLIFLIAAIGYGAWGWAFVSLLPVGAGLYPFFPRTPGFLLASDLGVEGRNGLCRWSYIRSLTYYEGGEDDTPFGLVAVLHPQGVTCLIRDIDRECAEQIIDAIYRRFPLAPMAESSNPPTLFGSWSELTTLGLNKKD